MVPVLPGGGGGGGVCNELEACCLVEVVAAAVVFVSVELEAVPLLPGGGAGAEVEAFLVLPGATLWPWWWWCFQVVHQDGKAILAEII